MTEQEAKLLTLAFILLIAALTIAYDIWVIRNFGPPASISRVCGDAMRAYPVITVWVIIGLGIYLGHIIGP